MNTLKGSQKQYVKKTKETFCLIKKLSVLHFNLDSLKTFIYVIKLLF